MIERKQWEGKFLHLCNYITSMEGEITERAVQDSMVI